MIYGSSPWLQRSWDARAAANFALGGTGSGILVILAFSDAGSAHLRAALVLALALVAAGLGAVWLEIGRPARAIHVLFNPFTSWMSRESFAAAALFALGAGAAAFPRAELVLAAALAALAFVYCQGRILQNARGIPAWREPAVLPLILATALAEGAGALIVAGTIAGDPVGVPLAGCAFAVIARAWAWSVYRRRLTSAARPCLDVLDRAGGVLLVLGTLVPLALLVAGMLVTQALAVAGVLAGIATLAAGWAFKIMLVTRAAFNQGFALPELPARGRTLN
jgi:phenylacetyl-CoA:acceptor oxidoreductase 26-kDa subunit